MIHTNAMGGAHRGSREPRRKAPDPLSPTELVLLDMLRENTGVSILDSGGTHGRHWQRNRKANPEMFKPTSLSFYTRGEGEPRLDIMLTHNVYHWLRERVTWSAEGNRVLEVLKRYRRIHKMPELYGIRLAEELPVFMQEYTVRNGGIGGEGEPVSVNTYNGADLLSQTLQFVYFTLDYTEYVALQIHNGADARGGYTEPQVFTLDSETSIFENANATIYCKHCSYCWHTDDAYHWYADGDGQQLNKFEARKGTRGKNGVVTVTPRGHAICPICAKGQLMGGT